MNAGRGRGGVGGRFGAWLAALLRLLAFAGVAWALASPLRRASARLAERALAWLEGPGYAMALRPVADGISVSSALWGTPAHLGTWAAPGLGIPLVLAFVAAAVAPSKGRWARVALGLWAAGLSLAVMAGIAALEIDLAVAQAALGRWGLAVHAAGSLSWLGAVHSATDAIVLAVPALLLAVGFVDRRRAAGRGGLGGSGAVLTGAALVALLAAVAALPAPTVSRADVLGLAERVRRLNPGSARAYGALGRASLAAGRPVRAIAAFRRALSLDPSNARLRTRLAALLAQRGGLGAAERELAAALVSEPAYVPAWLGLALVREAQGRPCAAAAALSRVPGALGRRHAGALGDLRARLAAACGRARSTPRAGSRATGSEPRDERSG